MNIKNKKTQGAFNAIYHRAKQLRKDGGDGYAFWLKMKQLELPPSEWTWSANVKPGGVLYEEVAKDIDSRPERDEAGNTIALNHFINQLINVPKKYPNTDYIAVLCIALSLGQLHAVLGDNSHTSADITNFVDGTSAAPDSLLQAIENL